MLEQLLITTPAYGVPWTSLLQHVLLLMAVLVLLIQHILPGTDAIVL